MSRALVTGATGMLGGYVVERLLADGWSVRALARRPRTARHLRGPGVEIVAGDITDAASVRAAADRCEAVVHAAAFIGAGGRREDFCRGNVRGTARVVEAAVAAGARTVHVSSTAVFGQARYRARPTDETVPLPRLPHHDLYGRSKQEAERVALRAHRNGRGWVSVVRPPVMYGRRDRQFAPRVGPLLRRGFFPLLGSGETTLPLVHAASVADGIVRALGTDVAGGRVYHLTRDFDLTVAELVTFAARGLDRPIRAPRIPVPVGRSGFLALQAVLVCVGRVDLARHATGTFRMLTRDNPFSAQRARDELGWDPPVPPAVGLPDAFRWWLEHAARPAGSGHAAGEAAAEPAVVSEPTSASASTRPPPPGPLAASAGRDP